VAGIFKVKLSDGSWATLPPGGPLLYGRLHLLHGDRWLRHVPIGTSQAMPLRLRMADESWDTALYLTQVGSRVRFWYPLTQFQPYPNESTYQQIYSTFPGDDWREDPIPVTDYECVPNNPFATSYARTLKQWHTTSPVYYQEFRRVAHTHIDLAFIRRRIDLGPGYSVTGATITITGRLGADLRRFDGKPVGVPTAPMGFRLLESTAALPLASATLFNSPLGVYNSQLWRYVDMIGENFSLDDEGMWNLRPGSVVLADAFTDYEADGQYGPQAWIYEKSLTAGQFLAADSIGYTLEVDDIVTPDPPDYPDAEDVQFDLSCEFLSAEVEIHTDPPTG
jgi:hypothetical protein